ncbi:hypothetical protein COJ60_08980 [Bacillus cereus]|nr:hypothetical protein II9_00392 [Bacillus cereus MSX-D12]PFN38207.1 hypothetical protein COJ60_08980 [Bacillus cereus]
MGFGSDVIEEKVSPCGDAFFCVSRAVVIVHEIYIGDFANISAQLEIYRRFCKYISATRNISAIIRIYRLSGQKRQLSQSLFSVS